MSYSKDTELSRKAWTIFHDKEEPPKDIKVTGKASEWPTKWQFAGNLDTIYYASDKWKADGDYLNYYHDTGAQLWLPQGSESFLTNAKKCPVKKFPQAMAVLGYCLGVDFRRASDYRFVRAQPEDELLCAFPNRKFLAVVHPRRGVVALASGRRLDVRAEGIVG